MVDLFPGVHCLRQMKCMFYVHCRLKKVSCEDRKTIAVFCHSAFVAKHMFKANAICHFKYHSERVA